MFYNHRYIILYFTEQRKSFVNSLNYLCVRSVLLAYARGDDADDLFERQAAERRVEIMEECIRRLEDAIEVLQKPAPWSADIKASDDFLEPLFEAYFRELGMPNQMRKAGFHVLATRLSKDDIDPEVVRKLDAIADAANQATPYAG